MKKITAILFAAAIMAGGIPAAAQTEDFSEAHICFWTASEEALPIRIYVDQEYIGDIAGACEARPEWLDERALNVLTSYDKHTIAAVNAYGEVYDGWPGYVKPAEGRVNYIKLGASDWVSVNRTSDAYSYIFLGWDPIVPPHPGPHHIHHGSHSWVDDTDELDTYAIIGMAVTAAAAMGAMTVAAVKNWDYPDSRYPYTSLGWNAEYMAGLEGMRNTVKLKRRIGGLGGMTLFADAGLLTTYDVPATSFTWCGGMSMNYGGFYFGLRYKPSFSSWDDIDFDMSERPTETFALADIGYDVSIGKKFILGFHTGFGVSGLGRDGLTHPQFELPLGLSLNWKL